MRIKFLVSKPICWILGHDWTHHRGGYSCCRCDAYCDCGRKKVYRNYETFREDSAAWNANFKSGCQWKAALKLADLAQDVICEIDEYNRGCSEEKKCDSCQMRELANVIKNWPNIPLKR